MAEKKGQRGPRVAAARMISKENIVSQKALPPDVGSFNEKGSLSISLNDDDDEEILSVGALLKKLAVNGPSAARDLSDAYDKMAAARTKYRRNAASGGGLLSVTRDELEEALEELEGELWPLIRDFTTTGQEAPKLLMAGARIMEELDQLESSRKKDKAGAGNGTEEASTYIPKCHEQLRLGANERFRDLLERMVHGSPIPVIIEESDAIATDLFDVTHSVGPFFPEHFEVLPFLRLVYMSNFMEVGRRLSARIIKEKDRDSSKVNKDISNVMCWSSKLKKRMMSMGLEHNLAEIHLESGALDPLVDEYTNRMKTFLGPALERIMDMELGKGVDRENPLGTDLPPEVFRWLHAQADQAKACSNSLLLANAAAAMASELCNFTDKYISSLKRKFAEDTSLEDGDLFVAVNDCLVCAAHTAELGKELMQHIEKQHQGMVDFKAPVQSFEAAAREAARLGVGKYLQDGGHFDRPRFVTPELMEELEDLLNVWSEWLREDAYPLAVEVCLEVLVVICVEHYAKMERKFVPDTLLELEEERHALEGLFLSEIDPEIVEDRLHILRDLLGIAAADSVDMFVLCYEGMLGTSWPECPPNIAEKLLSLHTHFSRSEVKACRDKCRELHQARDGKKRNPTYLNHPHLTYRTGSLGSIAAGAV